MGVEVVGMGLYFESEFIFRGTYNVVQRQSRSYYVLCNLECVRHFLCIRILLKVVAVDR